MSLRLTYTSDKTNNNYNTTKNDNNNKNNMNDNKKNIKILMLRIIGMFFW